MSQILAPIVDLLLFFLKLFNGHINSWGWSIVALTVMVKAFMTPLVIKQVRATESMKKWQPEVKKLQEKHKNDKEKQGQELMKFYKENKINPFGGCLPLLLQMPILFALFRLLSAGGPLTETLKGASFLGIPSLTTSFRQVLSSGVAAAIIPFVALFALVIVSQYGMQKALSTDPQQDKMMIPMMLFMIVICLSFPAGVLIYWVVYNLLSVAQHVAIAKTMD